MRSRNCCFACCWCYCFLRRRYQKLLQIGLIVWRENRDTLALFWTARICLRNLAWSVCILFFSFFLFLSIFFFLENLTIVPTFVTIWQIITFIFFRKFNQSLITKYTKRNGIAFTVHVKVKLLSNSLSLSFHFCSFFFYKKIHPQTFLFNPFVT